MALRPIISSVSRYCIPVHIKTIGTGAWGTAHLIIYVPLRLPEAGTVLKVFVANAGTVNGNFNVGLYSSSGTKAWETGSTAMSGTNAPQFVNIADQSVAAGLYYLAMQTDSTTAQYDRITASSQFDADRWGVLEEAAASFALPATATFVRRTATWVPVFGLDFRGSP